VAGGSATTRSKKPNAGFASQATSFYDAGIQKLVPLYDKCLNNGANYVEK
jgi:hypothetical protein